MDCLELPRGVVFGSHKWTDVFGSCVVVWPTGLAVGGLFMSADAFEACGTIFIFSREPGCEDLSFPSQEMLKGMAQNTRSEGSRLNSLAGRVITNL